MYLVAVQDQILNKWPTIVSYCGLNVKKILCMNDCFNITYVL